MTEISLVIDKLAQEEFAITQKPISSENIQRLEELEKIKSDLDSRCKIKDLIIGKELALDAMQMLNESYICYLNSKRNFIFYCLKVILLMA